MKKTVFLSGVVLTIAACVVIFLSAGCKKKSSEPETGNCQCWDQNWLLGTWEGTTPSSIQPFAGTKIRIVFQKAHLQQNDIISGNTRKTWTYDGILTWDVDGDTWSMDFDSLNFPLHNTILFECLTYCAVGQTVNNISIRVADKVQLPLMHTVDLDWGPVSSGTGTSPEYFDLYGDVELDNNGTITRADYPPEEGSMIRMTKR
jgi:hypothetical protein